MHRKCLIWSHLPQNAFVNRRTVIRFQLSRSGGEGYGEGDTGDASAPHPVPLPTRSFASSSASAMTYAERAGRGDESRVRITNCDAPTYYSAEFEYGLGTKRLRRRVQTVNVDARYPKLKLGCSTNASVNRVPPLGPYGLCSGDIRSMQRRLHYLVMSPLFAVFLNLIAAARFTAVRNRSRRSIWTAVFACRPSRVSRGPIGGGSRVT